MDRNFGSIALVLAGAQIAKFGFRTSGFGFELVVGYPSGQRGQTVNLLAYAFDGSNPSPTTIFSAKDPLQPYESALACNQQNSVNPGRCPGFRPLSEDSGTKKPRLSR